MLLHIQLKFGMPFSSFEHSIKFECHQFPSIFVGVMPLLELKILEIHSFPQLLWHIGLKCCIWLCFAVLQIKFEFCQFPSIFVGVMPLLDLRILEIHSFPHFSLTCFYILSWNFAYDCTCFTVLQFKFECRQFASIFVGVMPIFRTYNTGNTSFSAFFSYMLWYIYIVAEILHRILFYCASYQVWVSSICINFCRSYAPFLP